MGNLAKINVDLTQEGTFCTYCGLGPTLVQPRVPMGIVLMKFHPASRPPHIAVPTRGKFPDEYAMTPPEIAPIIRRQQGRQSDAHGAWPPFMFFRWLGPTFHFLFRTCWWHSLPACLFLAFYHLVDMINQCIVSSPRHNLVKSENFLGFELVVFLQPDLIRLTYPILHK